MFFSDTNTPIPVFSHTDGVPKHINFSAPKEAQHLMLVSSTMSEWYQAT
jgi:hypothetical protein